MNGADTFFMMFQKINLNFSVWFQKTSQFEFVFPCGFILAWFFRKQYFFPYLPGWVTDRLTNKKKGKANHQKEAFLVNNKCWYGLLWKPWLCLKHRSIIRNIIKWFIQACDASFETTQQCPQGMHQVSIFLVVSCLKHLFFWLKSRLLCLPQI